MENPDQQLLATEEMNLYDDYCEPNYPLVKTEYFDEDNLKALLNDIRFAKADRRRLTEYNKHRQSGSKILVEYRLARGCEENGLGRLFPNDGIGLQAFRFDIRNPLTKKNYWDTDMENAHYCIAERWCDRLDLPHQKITAYIQHREAWLLRVSDHRKKAKTEFLKILYGGNLKLYRDDYDDVEEGEFKKEGMKFLKELSVEVKALADKIWDTHPQFHKLKIGADKTPMIKKPNPKATLMSLIFQTDERKILMFYAFLLREKFGRNMGIFIHDGGEVERLDTAEPEMPKAIMAECSKIISVKFKTRVIITQKPIEYDWSPLNPKLTEYETRKTEFEKRNFFVGSQFIHIQKDGTIEFVKTSDMRVRQQCNNYQAYDPANDKTKKVYFFDEWLDDPNRANYEKIDFIPDLDLCPPEVFNLFKGFNADKLNPTKPLTNIEINLLVKPIIRHLNFLTSGYAPWILRWFAKIIQDPTHKSEVAVLLRDEGDFLKEGGGTGKNLLIEWIMNEIIGEDYSYVVGDNRELFATFNSQFEAKLMVMVEEASSKENHQNHDILKAKITSKKCNVNKKMVAGYTVRDYTNFIFCSNNRNPLPVKSGNRRMGVFDVDASMRGNREYFTELANHLNNPLVKWAFYQFLKSIRTYDTPIEFQLSIPTTTAMVEVRRFNAPLQLKWIVSEVVRGVLRNDTVRELYFRFKTWVKENKEGSEDCMMTETAFGIGLNKTTDAGRIENDAYCLDHENVKMKSGGVMMYKWNIPSVVAGLKKLHLLDPHWEYIATAEYDADDGTSTEDNEY
jgi:hypothetical protein